MNKYEDALMTLFCKAYTNDEVCEAHKCTKDESCLKCNVQKAFEKLQELVEKATPKKVIVEEFVNCFDCFDTCISYEEKIIKCPSCEQSLYEESEEIDLVGWDCCPNCGQALDWGDEE